MLNNISWHSLLKRPYIVALALFFILVFSVAFNTKTYAATDLDSYHFFGSEAYNVEKVETYDYIAAWLASGDTRGVSRYSPGNPLNCGTAAQTVKDKQTLSLFSEALGNSSSALASGDSETFNSDTWKTVFGLSGTKLTDNIYKLFGTLRQANQNGNDPCAYAADMLENAGIKLKSCEGTSYAKNCSVGGSNGESASDAESKSTIIDGIAKGCRGHWYETLKIESDTGNAGIAKNLIMDILGEQKPDTLKKAQEKMGGGPDYSGSQCDKGADYLKLTELADKYLRDKLNQKCKDNKDALESLKKATITELVAAYDSGCSALTEDTSETSDTSTTCAVDGIGWIICPVMVFMGKLNDIAFGVVNDLLTVETDLYESGSATENAWAKFRDVANVAFVIAFMFIIYSQMSSVGISNYGIKKLLPKLIIAALLVNLSYFICQILVDLSNVVGSASYEFLKGFASTPSGGGSASGWDKVIASILLLGVGVGLIAAVILAPTVLIAIGAVVLILIARKAIIIVLIVISPLAVGAYLLPNTEDWFKKWWKMFYTLLLVFPVVAIIFGASTMVSNILMGVAGQPGEDQNNMLAIVALAAMGIPLFAVPTVLKSAINAAGSIGAKIQGVADKRQAASSGKIKSRISDGKKLTQGIVARKTAGSSNKRTRALGRVLTGNTFSGRNFGAMAQKSENDATAAIMDSWNRQGILGKDDELEKMALNGNSLERQAALNQLSKMGSTASLQKIKTAKAGEDEFDKQFARAVQLNYGGLKEKDPGLVGVAPGNVKQADMHKMKDYAIESMASSDAGFRQNLAAAIADPEQQKFFSPDIQNKFGAQQGGTQQSDAKPAAKREFTSSQVASMGPENMQKAVEKRGGFSQMNDNDLITVRNKHGSSAVGQAAREELVSRGIATDTPKRNLP